MLKQMLKNSLVSIPSGFGDSPSTSVSRINCERLENAPQRIQQAFEAGQNPDSRERPPAI